MNRFELKSGAGAYAPRWVRCSWTATLAFAFAGSIVTRGPAYAAAATGKVEAQATNSLAKPAAAPNAPGSSGTPPQKPASAQRFDIDDFAVRGADKLPEIDLEEAIYPFLGPNKTSDDVEKARAALEKAYHDKGYQTVSVSIPPQNAQGKVIALQVTELKVGRLRVKNSRYFDLDKIKDRAGSLKEGSVPNFNDVTKDIVALNQWPDRRVTPALRAGVAPGTVDVDLNVEDTAPIHGTLEYNNRQSPSTTDTRINATVHYDNLWQLGHSASFTYQVAPERPEDAEVFSGSYLARVPDVDWLNVLFYGVKSSSNVASVGGTNIVGPGQIIGGRAGDDAAVAGRLLPHAVGGPRLQAFRSDGGARHRLFLLAGDVLPDGRELWRDLPGRQVHHPVQRVDDVQYRHAEQQRGRFRQ